MAEFVIVCDALVLNDKKEALFQKRKITGKEDMWTTPGGKAKVGEKLEDALAREVLEEHDVNINVLGYLQHSEVIRPKNHYLYFTYLAELKSGTPRIVEPDKCMAVGFFPLDNLPEPITKQTKDYITSYLNSGLYKK